MKYLKTPFDMHVFLIVYAVYKALIPLSLAFYQKDCVGVSSSIVYNNPKSMAFHFLQD